MHRCNLQVASAAASLWTDSLVTLLQLLGRLGNETIYLKPEVGGKITTLKQVQINSRQVAVRKSPLHTPSRQASVLSPAPVCQAGKAELRTGWDYIDAARASDLSA